MFFCISDSSLVGRSSGFDCNHDTLDYSLDRMGHWTSAKTRHTYSPHGGAIGVVLGNFQSTGNQCPVAGCWGSGPYPSLGGITTIHSKYVIYITKKVT